jgi:hypothetical protein
MLLNEDQALTICIGDLPLILAPQIVFPSIEIISSSELTIIDFTQLLKQSSNFRGHIELIYILAISICAVICGADSWEEIVAYAKIKKDWLTKFLSLPNGIPAHDTINRVMSSWRLFR